MLRSVMGELDVIDTINQSPAVRVLVRHAARTVDEALIAESRERAPIKRITPSPANHRHD